MEYSISLILFCFVFVEGGGATLSNIADLVWFSIFNHKYNYEHFLGKNFFQNKGPWKIYITKENRVFFYIIVW